MKKFTKILGVTALLFCVVMITGCGVAEAIKDTVEGSYNKWYKYEGSNNLEIPVLSENESDTDQTAESTNKLKNAEIYLLYNLDEGLTVAVQSKQKQEVSFLGGLYTNEVTVPMGGTTKISKDKFNAAAWGILWASGKIKKSSTPEIVADPEGCIVISGEDLTKPKIQWKKFISNYLLQMLDA